MGNSVKILHAPDWHIGRTLDGRKRYEVLGAFLAWLKETIQRTETDAFLMADDVFDTNAVICGALLGAVCGPGARPAHSTKPCFT